MEELGKLPDNVTVFSKPKAPLDFALLFVLSRPILENSFRDLASKIVPAGMIWVAWPKKASGVPTDLNENIVRKIGLDAGLVDVKICAVNDIWSGLKFMIRVKDRKKT